jgi:hypothetical protein
MFGITACDPFATAVLGFRSPFAAAQPSHVRAKLLGYRIGTASAMQPITHALHVAALNKIALGLDFGCVICKKRVEGRFGAIVHPKGQPERNPVAIRPRDPGDVYRGEF